MLQHKRIFPDRLLTETISLYQRRGMSAEIIKRLETLSPLGMVLAAGLRYEGSSRKVIETAMSEAGRRATHKMEFGLNEMGTIASIAPLMGLFGTVIGMIEIFGSQGPLGSNPQALAHGISIALYNTAFGLIIAIPAMIFYRYFRRRVETYVVQLEAAATELLNILAPEKQG